TPGLGVWFCHACQCWNFDGGSISGRGLHGFKRVLCADVPFGHAAAVRAISEVVARSGTLRRLSCRTGRIVVCPIQAGGSAANISIVDSHISSTNFASDGSDAACEPNV